MKKALILAVAMLSMASLTGCGSEPEQKNQPEVIQEAPEEVEEVASNGGNLGIGDFNVEFTKAEKVQSSDGELIRVTYNFENRSDETVAPGNVMQVVAFQDGVQITEIKDFLGQLVEPNNDLTSLRPGATLECQLLFKPETSGDIEIEAIQRNYLIDYDRRSEAKSVIQTYTYNELQTV